MAEFQSTFHRLLAQTPHLKVLMVTDKDGVILVQSTAPDLPKRILEPPFAATFTVSSDQMLKLGLGKTQSMMATFSHYQLIQLNYAPLVLTLIADMDANPGLLLSIGRDMEPLLQDIQRALRLL